jgi:hypothetical protein
MPNAKARMSKMVVTKLIAPAMEGPHQQRVRQK